MTLQAHPIRRIFARFFPKKYVVAQVEQKAQWDLASPDQKKEYAIHYLVQGELALLQGNLSALSFFETASRLDPENPQVWYRQGLAFFEYGSEEGKEKSLLLAGKYFKTATQINPSFFEAYVAWGNTLLQLGRFHEEHHFLLEAKEKYQKALSLSENQPEAVLAELQWDFGIVWMEIARHSGEALDLSLAIDSFLKAKELLPVPELFNDCGKAYLEMGMLINNPRLYHQSVEHLHRSVEASPQYFDGWSTLAESYSQLYINTMDERYATKASEAFANAIKLEPKNADVWLSWAQILAESGRLCKDPKAIHLSIEKCARACALDPKNSMAIAQWVESLSYLGSLSSRIDLLIEAESKILKATDTFPDDPDLWLAYGICLIAFGRYYDDPEYYEMAIEKLQWGLSIDRTSAEHWHSLGVAHNLYANLLEDEDLLERSCRFFSRAIHIKPSCPSLIFDTACAYFQLSQMSDDLPALETAIQHFESLLDGHRESVLRHPEWLFQYACALEWLGDFSSEETHYTRAIEIFSHVLLIHPDFPEMHGHLAVCYLELGHLTADVEFYKKAIHFFRIASRHDEENDQIWLDWGICLIHLAGSTFDAEFMNQLYWDAEQKINRSGQLGNAFAHYHLACLYSILNRTDESMEFIKKALNARALPSLDELAHDEWLENLRETEEFSQFFSALESKLHQAREE